MTASGRLSGVVVATMTLIAGLGAITLSTAPARALGQDQPGECGGVTFHDHNFDGARDGRSDAEAEPALENVRVSIVDEDGAFFERRTGADGSWGLRLQDDQYPIRILFESPPGYVPTVIGPDSNTAMQIIKSFEDCERRAQGSLGLYEVAHSCGENPELVTSCYVVGYADGHDDATAVLAVSDATTDNAATEARGAADWMDPLYRAIATTGEVGAVYGQAVSADGTVYAAGFVKRHTRAVSDLNPDGNPTVVYRIPAGREPEVLAVVDPDAPDPHGTIDDPDDYRSDEAAMHAVYRSGLGDLEISADGSLLYTVDLGRRALITIDAVDGTIESQVDLDGPALGVAPGDCAVSESNDFGDLRAFGLGFGLADELLVGVVCSAESTVRSGDLPVVETDGPGEPAGDPDALVGYVFAYVDGAFEQRLRWPLGGDRGDTQNNGLISNDAVWHPWVDVYPFAREHDAVSYPQPAVTDIAVLTDGTLVVALGDRWGHQTAPESVAPDVNGALIGITETVAAGDLQRACVQGTGWKIEGSTGCPGGFGDGVEFFGGEFYGWHAETALGSVARIPGGDQVVVSQMNPIRDGDAWRSGGLAWHDAGSGDYVRGLRLYDGRHASPESTFEKGSGIGDIAVSCTGPPAQLGGVVWFDTDADGEQDAAEPRIPGVVLELRNDDADIVATTVSDADGAYLFTADDAEGGLNHGRAYAITVARSNAEDGVLGPGGSHTGMRPTSAHATVTAELDSDATVSPIDSPLAGLATVHTIVGDDPATAGHENPIDHTLDIGFTDQYDLALTTVPGRPSAERGELQYDVVVRNQGSGTSGAFEISGRIPAGSTFVRATHDGVETTPGSGLVVWSIAESSSLDPGESRTLQLVVQVDDASLSPFVTVVEVTNDSGDDDDSVPASTVVRPETAGNAGGVTASIDPTGTERTDFDDNLEMPVEDDVGVALVGLYEFGGTLWFDADRSGNLETVRGDGAGDGETPVGAGVVVHLLTADGIRVATAETDAAGRYRFTSLPAGEYLIEIPASQFEPDAPLHRMTAATGPDAPAENTAIETRRGLRSKPFEVGADERAGRWSALASGGAEPTVDLGFFEQTDGSNPSLFAAVGVAALLLGGVSFFVRRRGRSDPSPSDG